MHTVDPSPPPPRMYPVLVLLFAVIGSFLILAATGHLSFAEAALVLPDEAEPLKGFAPLQKRGGVRQIRVGVLFSNEALFEYGSVANISTLVNSAAFVAKNEVFPGSGLGAGVVNFSLCFGTPRPVPAGFVERTSPGETLRAFASLSFPDDCTNFVLFSSLRGLGNRACGIGYLPGTRSVVAGLCFDENLSFVHELGHNLGFTHEKGFATLDGRFRSVMAYRYLCRGKLPCKRIPRYSSSASYWEGEKIGYPVGNNVS